MENKINILLKLALIVLLVFLLSFSAKAIQEMAENKLVAGNNLNQASINLSNAIERIKSYEKPSHIISDKHFSYFEIDKQDNPGLVDAYIYYDENWNQIEVADKKNLKENELEGAAYLIKIKVQAASKDFSSKKNEEIYSQKSFLSSKKLVISKNFFIEGEARDLSGKKVKNLIRLSTGKHYIYESLGI